jgi:hypothetical protein
MLPVAMVKARSVHVPSLLEVGQRVDARLKRAAEATKQRRGLVAGALPRVLDVFRELEAAGVGTVVADLSNLSREQRAVGMSVGYSDSVFAVLVVEPVSDGHLRATAHVHKTSTSSTEIHHVGQVEPGGPQEVRQEYRHLVSAFLVLVERELGPGYEEPSGERDDPDDPDDREP